MARQEDARIRYRVCQHLRRIPAPRTSLLQTNPILAALVERSANRRISAGFIVEDATGTTDRFHSYLALDNLPVISTDSVKLRRNQTKRALDVSVSERLRAYNSSDDSFNAC